jgi:hypothetical protein
MQTHFQANGRIAKSLVLVLTLVVSAACAPATIVDDDGVAQANVSRASLPSAVRPYQQMEAALACIRQTGAVTGKVFVVGPFADSTGKINSVAEGATGNFIPQGGSASYLTDALRKAGATVVSTYFGPPEHRVKSDYAINGIFNSLDFGAPSAVDLRVRGVGPVVATGFAQVSLTIQLDEAATRINRQISLIQRPVRFQQTGFGVGRDFDGTLVTGNVSVSNQERLQLEAINGPIALGVVDVLIDEFPAARAACGTTVQNLLQPFAAAAPDAPVSNVGREATGAVQDVIASLQ